MKYGKSISGWGFVCLAVFGGVTPGYAIRQSDDAVDEAVEEAKAAAEETCADLVSSEVVNNVIAQYRRFITLYRHTPSKQQLVEFLKLPEDALDAGLEELNLEGIDDLERLARKKMATTKVFEKVVDRKLFSHERRESILEAVKNRSRILITSADIGKAEEKFFQGLMTYCKYMDAELFVIPINMRTEGLDERWLTTPGVHIVTHDIELGDIVIRATAIPGTRRNPFTNMEGLRDRMGLQIVGHPKLLDIQVPTLHNDWSPHRMMATGKATAPFQEAMVRGILPTVAQEEEMLGAIVLEKHLGNPHLQNMGGAPGFHARHVEYVAGEGFADQGYVFNGNTMKKQAPLGLVMGDIHVGQTDPMLIEALVQQILALKPKYIFLHDIFNGQSISHHEFNNFMTRMDLAHAGKLNLRNEILQLVSFVNALMARVPGVKVVIDSSNHDYWLKRRLEDAQKVMADLQNAQMSIQLWELHQREPEIPPLLQAMRMFTIDHPERLLFMRHAESFEFGGLIDGRLAGHEIQVGLHGHAGANGGKGSLLSLMKGVFSSISGDSHTADRRNQAVKTGTLTKYKLGYNNEGFSSWAQAVVLLYPSGSKQTLRFTRGSFYTPGQTRLEFPDNFYREGFPHISPTRSGGEEFSD